MNPTPHASLSLMSTRIPIGITLSTWFIENSGSPANSSGSALITTLDLFWILNLLFIYGVAKPEPNPMWFIRGEAAIEIFDAAFYPALALILNPFYLASIIEEGISFFELVFAERLAEEANGYWTWLIALFVFKAFAMFIIDGAYKIGLEFGTVVAACAIFGGWATGVKYLEVLFT